MCLRISLRLDDLGTGKTLIPQVVARELNCSLLVMKLSEVVVGEVGGGEKKIAQLFADARKAAPSIVFIDEFQALFMKGLSTMSAALAGCFDDVANWNSCMGAERLVRGIISQLA
jgi:AAA+ superfamily predicted ATPase